MYSTRLFATFGMALALTLVTFGALAALGGASPGAQAATFTVTKFTDSADGTCGADCSLREAIIAANADTDPDTITLGSGAYILSITGVDEDNCATGDLDITDPLTITGQGPGNTIIDAQGIDRVLDIRSGAGTVVITGVTLQNGVVSGTARDEGAGLYFNAGSHQLINTQVYSNRAAGDSLSGGGGVQCDHCRLTLVDSQIVSNTTGGVGGGLYVTGPTAVVTHTGASRIAHNQATETAGSGGGVYLYSGELRIPSGQVMDNHAGSLGGGIYDREGILRLNGGQVVNNSADTNGGGVYVGNGAVFTQTGLSSLIGYNHAGATYGVGGGLVVGGGASVWLNGGQVLSNSAVGAGGGINVLGDLTLKGAWVLSNSTDSAGGGLFMASSASRLTVDGLLTRIAHNSSGAQGGGISAEYGILQIANGLIWDNEAAHGGGIHVGAAQATMSGGGVFSNTAGGNGGGLHLGVGSAFTQSGSSTIRENQANNGGGIYIEAGRAALLGGDVISNTSSINGGGVVVYGTGGNAATLTLDGSQILGNTTSGSGGGIHVSQAPAVLTQTGDALIAFNRAGDKGGGLWVVNGSVLMTGARFFSNTAVVTGGAVYNSSAAPVLVADGCILGSSDTGMVNIIPGNVISATGNWWGDADGPGGVGPGDGDTVGVNVDYSGWRTLPPIGCGGERTYLPIVLKAD
jgi:fibronectin-binding autotransporter adhesin